MQTEMPSLPFIAGDSRI